MTTPDRATYTLYRASTEQTGIRDRLVSWLKLLRLPATFTVVADRDGNKIHLRAETLASTADAFSRVTRNACHWIPSPDAIDGPAPDSVWMLQPTTDFLLPADVPGDWLVDCADAMHAVATELDCEIALHVTTTDLALDIQDRLRAVAADKYELRSVEGNWYDLAARLTIERTVLPGILLAIAVLAALTTTGVLAWSTGIAAMVAGVLLLLVGLIRSRWWLRLYTTPRDTLKRILSGDLFRVCCSLEARGHGDADVVSALVEHGMSVFDVVTPVEGDPEQRKTVRADRSRAFLLPACDLAAILEPANTDSASMILHPETKMPAPTPRPTRPLKEAPVMIGRAVAGSNAIGIDIGIL